VTNTSFLPSVTKEKFCNIDTRMMTGNGVMHNGTTIIDDYGVNLDKLKVANMVGWWNAACHNAAGHFGARHNGALV
jgi:hypothetical protein